MIKSIQERLRYLGGGIMPPFDDALLGAADRIDKLEAAIRFFLEDGIAEDCPELNQVAYKALEAALPSEPALKPCPFCGGKAEGYTDQGDFFYCKCLDCKAASDVSYETGAEAREAWNRRA